jgi:hypothetical protein
MDKEIKIAMLDMEVFDNRSLNQVGSSRIRGRWVRKYCPEIEAFKNGTHYDVVIYQKAYYKEHMQQFKGVKIFDICDPDWMDGRPITEVADMVDAFTVPTQAMKDFITQVTDKPVVIIPDRIDPDEHTPIKETHEGKARTVVWFGYSSNQVVLNQCLIGLRAMGLNLAVISERPYREADVNLPYNFGTICEDLTKHDIILLPDYKTDRRHKFKSPNKTLTGWALKMPVASTPEDLERFMSADERNKEAEMRYNEVMTEHHVRNSGPQYLELINNLIKEKNNGTK